MFIVFDVLPLALALCFFGRSVSLDVSAVSVSLSLSKKEKFSECVFVCVCASGGQAKSIKKCTTHTSARLDDGGVMAAPSGTTATGAAAATDPDVTDGLDVTIVSHQDQGHIVYLIETTVGVLGESYQAPHRYSDFVALAAHVTALTNVDIPLPPKRFMGNKTAAVIEERKRALEGMLQTLARHPILRHDMAVRQFLLPTLVSDHLADENMRGVSLFFRSNPNWLRQQDTPLVGWRVAKEFVLVQTQGYATQDSQGPKYLAWRCLTPLGLVFRTPTFTQTRVGGHPHVEAGALASALKYLAGISHPFIAPAIFGGIHEASGLNAVVVRNLYPKGSIRDHVCKNKNPQESFVKKYCCTKYKPFDERRTKLYGRQILEAISFCHAKNIPLGHIHSGNIMVVSDQLVHLTDIETGILGISGFYDGHVKQLKKVNTLERRDVYCFGHVLFEMVFGRPLGQLTLDEALPSGPHKEILELLLSPRGVRSLPTVSQLLAMPYFKDVNLGAVERGSFKLSARVRDALASAQTSAHQVLREQQAQLMARKRQDEQVRDEEKRSRQRDRELSRQVRTNNGSSFSKRGLKKAETNDRSGPLL
ncbi:uncharacterized protein MONBRDRAFT_25828 [Monosiga brevicollis MX1]|uniref:PX domain-containing protein n=1 Tax=Monosiga brevicollis TaxID=81824 RepID=A9V0J8_MONBE|nr:uncharacterized protein MONBRDRAFT_25828 [Monosiga brevicollis MX1]EDQ89164.1 predicted protein [Monosiga brevicollis MX1]|eukprot:XP_001746269.1 hypothetical protein [Monosiga brevicollis MX1]